MSCSGFTSRVAISVRPVARVPAKSVIRSAALLLLQVGNWPPTRVNRYIDAVNDWPIVWPALSGTGELVCACLRLLIDGN